MAANNSNQLISVGTGGTGSGGVGTGGSGTGGVGSGKTGGSSMTNELVIGDVFVQPDKIGIAQPAPANPPTTTLVPGIYDFVIVTTDNSDTTAAKQSKTWHRFKIEVRETRKTKPPIVKGTLGDFKPVIETVKDVFKKPLLDSNTERLLLKGGRL